MNILAQLVPFLLLLIYPVLTIVALVAVFRFVRAVERIARALEDGAGSLRHLRRRDGNA